MIAGACYGPMLDEMYWAELGKGAYCNGKKIHVTKTNSLETAMVCTGFAYDVKTNPLNNLNNFSAFILKAQAVRRDGAAVLNICYTARGRYDGFWNSI